GVSGTPFPSQPGGSGGTPSQVRWLYFQYEPSGYSDTSSKWWFEDKFASAGENSEAGPEPDAAAGPSGSFRVDNNKPHAWITPINLTVAIQYARDACATGNSEYATALLSQYVNALAGSTVDPELQQPLREASELLRLSAQNADYFGKPPGWVPSLSLEGALDVYDTLLPQAMQQLYASYYVGKIAQSKQDKQQALVNLRGAINDSTESAKDEL